MERASSEGKLLVVSEVFEKGCANYEKVVRDFGCQ